MSLETKKWVNVGWIQDAHGIKGELFLGLKAKRADWLDRLQELAIEDQTTHERQIYEVKEARPHKKGLILRLSSISTRNEAESLKGGQVEIPEAYLKAEAGERIYLRDLLDFQVEDVELGPLGAVVGFSSNGPQDLLVIETAKGRSEIPLVDDFICRFEWEEKRLIMQLPPGLVEG